MPVLRPPTVGGFDWPHPLTMLLPLEQICSRCCPRLSGFCRSCSSKTAFWLEIICICRSKESIIASEYAGDAGTWRPGVSPPGVSRPGVARPTFSLVTRLCSCCCCCLPPLRHVATGVRSSAQGETACILQSTASSDETRSCRGRDTGRNGSAWRNSRTTVQASRSCASSDCSSDCRRSARPSSDSFLDCNSLLASCSWRKDSSRSCKRLRNRATSGSSWGGATLFPWKNCSSFLRSDSSCIRW